MSYNNTNLVVNSITAFQADEIRRIHSALLAAGFPGIDNETRAKIVAKAAVAYPAGKFTTGAKPRNDNFVFSSEERFCKVAGPKGEATIPKWYVDLFMASFVSTDAITDWANALIEDKQQIREQARLNHQLRQEAKAQREAERSRQEAILASRQAMLNDLLETVN